MIFEVLYFLTFVKSATCVRVELPAVYYYQLSWDVINRTDFKFSVQAERNALLSLDTDRPSNNDPELLIGGGGNSFTTLRNCFKCNHFLKSKFHSPLSKTTAISFWLGFQTEKIIFGFGKLANVDEIFNYSPFPSTNRIWITSYTATTSFWEIPDYLTMRTPPTLIPDSIVYWDVSNITSVLLSIETCGSVDLIFTTTSSGDYYQVGFGDCSNTSCTTITKFLSSSTPTTMTATVNPLQCSSFTDIWISWESSAGKLEVGTGRNLTQNVLVAMENLDDLNTIIKMEPRGTNTTQWKIDPFGCEFLNWQKWSSWSTCDILGQIQRRYRICQCAHPPSDPNFDILPYCGGNDKEEVKRSDVLCRKLEYKGKLYSTTMDKSVITGVSKAACMVNCGQLTPPCYYMSYNKLDKLCWMYNTGIPIFKLVSHQFIPNPNFTTYAYNK